MPATKLTDYMLTAEAAGLLGVSENTLRKWAARGDIPMHRNPVNGYRLRSVYGPRLAGLSVRRRPKSQS